MDGDAAGRRPTKLVLAALVLFLLAVVLGRLLVAGGAAWALLGLAVPVVLAALGAAVGLRASFVLTTSFVAAVLAARWVLRHNTAGWVSLMLLPVLALTALLVGKVLMQMRRKPVAGAPADAEALDERAP